ncbi:TPA: hypothetical protein ACH3X3_009974 [Trebouxia sp. C0006]
MEDFEARKAGLKPLKLAKDNRARPDQEDALYGANIDAHSLKWTGASHVTPEYKAVAMATAMRRASLSAEDATKPVLTTFVLPWWDDKGSSYARWLSDQTVQAVATIDRSKFKLTAPRHWADEQDQ